MMNPLKVMSITGATMEVSEKSAGERSAGNRPVGLNSLSRCMTLFVLLAWGLVTAMGCATPVNDQAAPAFTEAPPAHTAVQAQDEERLVHEETEMDEAYRDPWGYRLGIGDVVMVNVWREPILSGETFVRSDGRISINLLGDVDAAGRTPMELRDEIQSALAEYIENPVVTVTLQSPTSQKYYVVGEVKSPGEFDLITDLTLLQAIARSGGFTDWASRRNLLLIRHTPQGEERVRINYDDVVRGQSEVGNIPLKANDTLVVP